MLQRCSLKSAFSGRFRSHNFTHENFPPGITAVTYSAVIPAIRSCPKICVTGGGGKRRDCSEATLLDKSAAGNLSFSSMWSPFFHFHEMANLRRQTRLGSGKARSILAVTCGRANCSAYPRAHCVRIKLIRGLAEQVFCLMRNDLTMHSKDQSFASCNRTHLPEKTPKSRL